MFTSIVKMIIVIIVVVAIGWYGNYLYKQNGSTFDQLNASADLVKCITKDGSVIYGKIPHGTICEKTEAVKRSITVVPGEKHSKTENGSNSSSYSSIKESNSASRFKCDGRKFCSQMTSCDEAKFFQNNCPNTKMDGNNDGIPCEEQWCR
jgi:Excalibur calcium-binding domain